ncbi:MAG: hypothetical protein H9535_19665 [Ignavibacteria bacterium]|nr:hypothetical protein [Ignavibacteria bacterium]
MEFQQEILVALPVVHSYPMEFQQEIAEQMLILLYEAKAEAELLESMREADTVSNS